MTRRAGSGTGARRRSMASRRTWHPTRPAESCAWSKSRRPISTMAGCWPRCCRMILARSTPISHMRATPTRPGAARELEPAGRNRTAADREDLRDVEAILWSAPDALARTGKGEPAGAAHGNRLQLAPLGHDPAAEDRLITAGVCPRTSENGRFQICILQSRRLAVRH
jgi:hypothetical protein